MAQQGQLPVLRADELGPTRDYLREVALVMSSLQRAFLPKHPRQWQYGLEVTLRGLATQAFTTGGKERRAVLDLVKYKLRLDDNYWALREYSALGILNNAKEWLTSHDLEVSLGEPQFAAGVAKFDTAQADSYAEAMWWYDKQFRALKAQLSQGVTAPILLYPHHFDLSLVWFPYDDERQLAIGWSTGDETIPEPYVYLTAYPEPVGFTDIKLPQEAYWQKAGFSGAILPYAKLRGSPDPAALFQQFASHTFAEARKLL